MRNISLIYFASMFIISFSFGQNVPQEASKKSKVSTTYNRNAISVIVLDNNGKYVPDLKKASAGINIPSKFDDNLLGTRYVSASSNNIAIEKALIKNKIPNEIIAKWFSRDISGKFNMDVVHKRGMYNATSADVQTASESKIGLAQLKDAGEILINHSYILVLEFTKIESMEEKAKAQAAAQAKAKADASNNNQSSSPLASVMSAVNVSYENKNGWEGKVKASLYRLNFNDSIMNMFYNDLWIYEDDDDATIAAKKNRFDALTFPISFVMETEANADGSQYNAGQILAPATQLTRNELFQKMINTGMNEAIFDFERKIEQFRVKAPLYATNPLRASIGLKEGLKSDSRYFVYEFEQKRNGETKANRKGVVRVKKTTDNRTEATGDAQLFSTFYQTAGFGLMEGMFLQERRDIGIGISSSYGVLGQIGGISVKAEVNVAVLGGRLLNADMGTNQFKLYASFGSQTKKYTLPSNVVGAGTYDFNFGRFEVGFSKGWYFAKNFSMSPFIGYGIESASSDKWSESNPNLADTSSIGTDYISIGTNASINLFHWMQLVGSVNIINPIKKAYDSNRDDLVGLNGKTYTYIEAFEKRRGFMLELGVRVEF